VKDITAKELASDKGWSFTITPDEIAPSVVKVNPSQGATGIASGVNVVAAFSQRYS
jgi:hypothetical protein